MKIQKLITLIDGRYHVQMNALEFSAGETDLLEQFDDIIVDVGGQFDGSATRKPTPSDPTPVPIVVSFLLPTKHRRLSVDFPVKEIFDTVDFADVDIRAKVYADEIENRLISARAELVALDDTSNFLGETIITIN